MRGVKISLFVFLLSAATISFCEGNSNVLCIESERKALLKFKHDLIDQSNKLFSWVDDEDCCEWNGVFCNNSTGHVNQLHLGLFSSSLLEYATAAEWDAYYRLKLGGKINPSLLDLRHLNFLDLSNNDLGRIQIPKFIGSLKRLTYLNLSGANFNGAIPYELGNLSKLHYLDLGGSSTLKAETLQWVSHLSSLQYLDLSGAYLNNATDWLQVTNKLASLVELHLSDCHLNDPLPIGVNYTSLVVLDLSGNKLSSIPTWMFSHGSLVSIDLSDNRVEGVIPDGFQNLSSLEFLDLGRNPFSSSSIPNWLSNLNQLRFLGLSRVGLRGNFPSVIGKSLCNLREMDLSNNGIDQEVSEIIDSLSKCSLECLESLNLGLNKLSGHLTDQVGQFKSLAYFYLNRNSISGPIPFSIGMLSLLKVLDVSDNRLNATLPQSLGQLGNLECLDVSNNMLEGNISEMHFSNLTRLRILRASNNMLTFKPNPSWTPPFHCHVIELGNWHLGPQFPQWLQHQKNLSQLGISHAEISGVVPNWFWNLSTQFHSLNFSNNQLTGGIPYLPAYGVVDLSFNKFTSPLPPALDSNALFLSNNLFSGSFSNFLCNFSNYLIDLKFLDIESNLLSGEMPNCWENVSFLMVLNLGNNNMTGKIPRSMGTLRFIMSLNLRNNNLSGEVPSSLQQLAEVLLLDLSENQFTGKIPAWIGEKLSNLVVLNLHSNNFQVSIPDEICALNSLRVLDLGYNNISGAIPKCFTSLSAMTTKAQEVNLSTMIQTFGTAFSFYLSTSLVMKGREDEYSSILGLVTSIDLSVNNLEGEISEELGNLIELRSLNLSENLLTGKIPKKIGNIKSLESLDLSMNRLYGEIPSSISKLNFLNHLNLSYNNLTGQIPSGTQLQSFDKFSYIGNHLCGPPLTKNCSTNGKTHNVSDGGNHEGRKWSKVNGLYVSIVVEFVMGFWGVVAPLVFIKSWRFAYCTKLERIGDKLYVFWANVVM